MNNDDLQSPELERLRKGVGGLDGVVEPSPSVHRIRQRARRQRAKEAGVRCMAAAAVALAAFGVRQYFGDQDTPRDMAQKTAVAQIRPVRAAPLTAAKPLPGKKDRLDRALAKLDSLAAKKQFTAPREETAAILLAAAKHWETLDRKRAQERYREIIERFPGSRAAATAQRILYDTSRRNPQKEKA